MDRPLASEETPPALTLIGWAIWRKQPGSLSPTLEKRHIYETENKAIAAIGPVNYTLRKKYGFPVSSPASVYMGFRRRWVEERYVILPVYSEVVRGN